MKYCRFEKQNAICYGIIEDDQVIKVEGDLFEHYIVTEQKYSLDEVKLLAPCVPSKVVAVGLNYRDHAQEMKETIPDHPKIFLKPATAIIGPEDPIVIPAMSQRVDYEAEIAVVMKKTAKNISAEESSDYILGYTCLNDVTARDLQSIDGQWTRAKGFDTFAPVGPWITDELDPNHVDVQLFLNGEQKQHSNTSNFIWKIEELISFISQIMTLLPGDIITTGTPSGIGPMKEGDKVEVIIEKIGTLRNYVK